MFPFGNRFARFCWKYRLFRISGIQIRFFLISLSEFEIISKAILLYKGCGNSINCWQLFMQISPATFMRSVEDPHLQFCRNLEKLSNSESGRMESGALESRQCGLRTNTLTCGPGWSEWSRRYWRGKWHWKLNVQKREFRTWCPWISLRYWPVFGNGIFRKYTYTKLLRNTSIFIRPKLQQRGENILYQIIWSVWRVAGSICWKPQDFRANMNFCAKQFRLRNIFSSKFSKVDPEGNYGRNGREKHGPKR